MHHPPGVDEFTHLEALRTPLFEDFYASSGRHEKLLIPFLAPHNSLEGEEWG